MEAEFITWLRQQLPDHPQLLLGIGDDAAVLRLSAGANCVLTSDAITEGVDFRLSETAPRAIGRKALAVNLSDLAAMAAKPLSVIVSLILPRANARQLAKEIYAGILPLAEEFQVSIAGGDTNTWDGGLVISVTAIGETTSRGALKRSGAKPGDAILVTGELGGSILGHHLDFTPRLREALELHERFELHAGTDISDGLEIDLFHLCQESSCGAVLYHNEIPVSSDAHGLARMRGDGVTALEHARTDGEDFELLLAVPQAEAQRLLATHGLSCRVTRIGEFVPEFGLWEAALEGGSRCSVKPRGWQHRGDDEH